MVAKFNTVFEDLEAKRLAEEQARKKAEEEVNKYKMKTQALLSALNAVVDLNNISNMIPALLQSSTSTSEPAFGMEEIVKFLENKFIFQEEEIAPLVLKIKKRFEKND